MVNHKEKITTIAHRHDIGSECEVTIEYSENVIDVYWEPNYDGEPLKDRMLFSLDYNGNFKQVIERIINIWP